MVFDFWSGSFQGGADDLGKEMSFTEGLH
jgi:hypothetical protein